MKILLLGPPASGKGTQAKKLAKVLGVPRVSSGQVLRDLPDTGKFVEMHNIMASGGLPPSEMVAKIIEEYVSDPKFVDGYILEGWGRRVDDVTNFNPGWDYVIYVSISEEEGIKRISGRRMCEKDGFTCNIHTLGSDSPDSCEICGGKLVQREDDNEESARKRFEVFRSDTLPTIEKYRTENEFIEVDGSGSPDEVFKLIIDALKQKGVKIPSDPH